MVVQLSVVVGNVNALMALGYTHVEIHRSTDQGNTYSEITSSVAQAASLLSSPALTTFRMSGKKIQLQINGGAVYDITFNTVVEYWTPAQVAARINEVIAGLATVVGNTVKLTSSTTGRGSSILVIYNDATDLGWTAGLLALGTAARIPFVSNTLVYTFPDIAGSSTDRYKWRWSANGSAPISEFSPPVFGDVTPLVPTNELSVGTALFVGIDGTPKKTKVLVGLPDTVQGVNARFAGNGLATIFESDDNGFLQMPLVRGLKIRVAIEGTLYVREITVPDAASFDLLTVMAAAPDPFSVQTTPPLLTRRSL